MRDSVGDSVYINPAVKADLRWFLKYFESHNASAIITTDVVTHTIEADSSMMAGTAWSTAGTYYVNTYSNTMSRAYNICQLEAINYLVAIRALIKSPLPGSRYELIGDNEGAIAGIVSGRACDAIVSSMARAIWFFSAHHQIDVAITHKRGVDIPGADVLSRSVITDRDARRARAFVRQNSLQPVHISPAYSNYQKYM